MDVRIMSQIRTAPGKGLSRQPCLPRLDRVRLGLRVMDGGKAHPRPVDYFVCPEAVKKVYGQRPTQMRILFPDEDDSRWAAQSFRCYSARGLVCKGDGRRASALLDEDTGWLATASTRRTSHRQVRCSPQTCRYHGRQCRRVMSLQFLLPDVPGLGVWQIDTSSCWSMANISSGIRLIRRACGRVSMIPLLLKLVPKQVWPHGQNRTVHVLALDMPLPLVDMLRYAGKPLFESGLPPHPAPPPATALPAAVGRGTNRRAKEAA